MQTSGDPMRNGEGTFAINKYRCMEEWSVKVFPASLPSLPKAHTRQSGKNIPQLVVKTTSSLGPWVTEWKQEGVTKAHTFRAQFTYANENVWRGTRITPSSNYGRWDRHHTLHLSPFESAAKRR